MANPDVFEVMTGWVTTIAEEKCILAFPNKGDIKLPTINVDGSRLTLVEIETLSLPTTKYGAWQKLVRMKSKDGSVQVELRYRVAHDECSPESSCYPTKYGEMVVARGGERFVVAVHQQPV